MNEFEVEADHDAEVIYQGACKIGKYARTNAGVQSFTLKDFEHNDQFLKVVHDVPANTPVKLIGGVGEDLYFNGWDVQLKKAGDGVRTGPHMDFHFYELDYYSYETIKSLKDADASIDITIIKGEIHVKEKPKKGPHGDFAQRLMRSKLICMPEFWTLVGSEAQYEKWLQRQPCAVTGDFHKHEVTGEKLCEVAHVRDINFGAGIARKPPYYAIPFVRRVHEAEHKHGISHVWKRYGNRYVSPEINYPIDSELSIVKAWFRYLAEKHIKMWIKDTIKQSLNVPSLSFVSEEMFRNYLTSISAHDMIRFL